MRPILAIEQDERLPGLGLFGVRVIASGLPVRRLQTWRSSLAGLRARDFAAIVALGGNAHAWDEDEHPFLRDERRLLAEAVEADVPVLGICLGAQVLARALGAAVEAAGAHEAGWHDIVPTRQAVGDALLGHLAGPAGVYHWHADRFELPAGAIRLASTEDTENQAFRLGSAWGLQFHPEVDYGTFAHWVGNHPGACERHGLDEARLHEDVRAGDRATRVWRSRLFDAFLELAALRAAA